MSEVILILVAQMVITICQVPPQGKDVKKAEECFNVIKKCKDFKSENQLQKCLDKAIKVNWRKK